MYTVLVVKLVVSVVLLLVTGIVVMLVMTVVFVSVIGTVFVVDPVVMVVDVTAQTRLAHELFNAGGHICIPGHVVVVMKIVLVVKLDDAEVVSVLVSMMVVCSVFSSFSDPSPKELVYI